VAWMTSCKKDDFDAVYVDAKLPKQDYLAKMARNGAWGGAPEILAAAQYYKLVIFVVPRDHGQPVLKFAPPKVTDETRRVALWWTGQHFDRIVPKEDQWKLLGNAQPGKALHDVRGGATSDTEGEGPQRDPNRGRSRRRRHRRHRRHAHDAGRSRSSSGRIEEVLTTAMAAAAARSPERISAMITTEAAPAPSSGHASPR
jgi:hypothetical protein